MPATAATGTASRISGAAATPSRSRNGIANGNRAITTIATPTVQVETTSSVSPTS
jgi:hypothetical protein